VQSQTIPEAKSSKNRGIYMKAIRAWRFFLILAALSCGVFTVVNTHTTAPTLLAADNPVGGGGG
jgi:hypothetical protein